MPALAAALAPGEGAPLTARLFAGPRDVRVVAASGRRRPRPARAGMRLLPGDRLVGLRPGHDARVRLGPDAVLWLHGRAEVRFADALPATPGARVALERGSLRLALVRHLPDGAPATIVVDVAGTAVSVSPGARAADCEIRGNARRGEVLVHAGSVRIGSGAAVAPGQRVPLAAGHALAELPLAEDAVAVHRGVAAVVWDGPGPIPVDFVLGAQPALLEVAFDAEFRRVVYAERSTAGHLVVARLPNGRYFWRVDEEPGTRAELVLDQEPAGSRPDGAREIVAEDNGQPASVTFAAGVRGLVLRWPRIEGAARYEVKIFADGQFEVPWAQPRATAALVRFPEGSIPAGAYYWVVAAYDREGHELAHGNLNPLTVAYQRRVAGLEVDAPAPNARTDVAQIIVSGTSPLPGGLFVNDEAVEVDPSKRYATPVRLRVGQNAVRVATRGEDGVEHVTVRRVLRTR